MNDLLDRVPMSHRPMIERARELIDRHITRPFVWPRYLGGVSPLFVGLHDYVRDDGVSYDDVAHCVYSHNQHLRPRDDRKPTVVVPYDPALRYRDIAVGVVVHEFAHAALHLDSGWMSVPTTTTYSTTDVYEAFAEATEILVCAELGAYRGWPEKIDAMKFDPLRDFLGYRP